MATPDNSRSVVPAVAGATADGAGSPDRSIVSGNGASPSGAVPQPRGIPRKLEEPDPYAFETLRDEGIKLIEQLCSDEWTDYNLHDPGITILEQLCYGLTEAIYRVGFDVADHLTGPDGEIAFEPQSLHPPEDILPCRPTTANDYRLTLLDAVEGLDNVWLGSEASASDDKTANSQSSRRPSGRYDITVRLRDDDDRADVEDATKREVCEVFRRNRNLCEDLASVTVAESMYCDLIATVVVSGAKNPDDILAQIYHQVAERIAADIAPRSVHDVKGMSLEEVFSGPKTRALFAHPGSGRMEKTPPVFIAELVSLVQAVDGVARVDELHIRTEQHWPDKTEHREAVRRVRRSPDGGAQVLRLRVTGREAQPAQAGVRLMKAGREVPVTPAVWHKYEKLRLTSEARRRAPFESRMLHPAPRGRYRKLNRYHPVRYHFPDIYGVNAYGVPESAPLPSRVKAAQLTAYLMPLEQILANFAATLHELRNLFSTARRATAPTYDCEQLEAPKIPGIGPLYRDNDGSGAFLEKVMRRFDNRVQRRSRLLDHMLAIFGEKFTQASLRHFNYYHDAERVEEIIVRNKLAFLKSIVTVTRDRAAAFDYGKPSWTRRCEFKSVDWEKYEDPENISGLQERVGLLLDFPRPRSRSLTYGLRRKGLRLVRGRSRLKLDDGTDRDAPYEAVRPRKSGDGDPEAILAEIRGPAGGEMSVELFRGGVVLDRYLVRKMSDGRFRLVFKPLERDSRGAKKPWLLREYDSRREAEAAANALKRYLVELNIECEGLHVVEHVLLRPAEPAEPAGADVLEDLGDFYRLRLSVFFPAWTTRCADPNFRKLAEETVGLNCPAHLRADCHWLEVEEMREFEALYDRWLIALRHRATSTDQPSPRRQDAAAERLREFITRPRIRKREADS